jgi:hypothetical protein
MDDLSWLLLSGHWSSTLHSTVGTARRGAATPSRRETLAGPVREPGVPGTRSLRAGVGMAPLGARAEKRVYGGRHSAPSRGPRRALSARWGGSGAPRSRPPASGLERKAGFGPSTVSPGQWPERSSQLKSSVRTTFTLVPLNDHSQVCPPEPSGRHSQRVAAQFTIRNSQFHLIS